MFAIAWQYLTGSAFAAQVVDRQLPEWPPHPDRVFQALVASWGERGLAADEREALTWLETLDPPEIAAPLLEQEREVAPPRVYVPVNDQAGERIERARKERFFPSVRVGDAVCALRWPHTEPGPHRAALARLAGAVTRIGHSASMVRAWVEDQPPAAMWIPAGRGQGIDVHLRVPEPGRLQALVRNFSDGGSNWRRPPTASWCPYALSAPAAFVTGHMSGPMIILRRAGGSALGLSQSLALSMALRAALLPYASDASVLAMLSGHEHDGKPLGRPHAAFIPLAFVGSAHADGHLLGAAIVLPASISADEEDGVFRAIVAALHPETAALELNLANNRTLSLAVEDRPAAPLALRASTWSRTSRVWSTVSPIVLDRQAPRRHPDRDGFAREAIAEACVQAGLPRPVEVRVLDAAVSKGPPNAKDFPPMPTKAGLQRRQVHAWLRFETPVRGPVLLGAGRYRGYGLCRAHYERGEA